MCDMMCDICSNALFSTFAKVACKVDGKRSLMILAVCSQVFPFSIRLMEEKINI